MSYFVCPHCNQQTDIFSRGGVEKTARQFAVPYLGEVQLDPKIREAGDNGSPAVLMDENSPSVKSLYDFARKVVARVTEIKSTTPDRVIQIQ